MPKWTDEQELEAVKQQLPPLGDKSAARGVEDVRMERDLYRGTLIGLLSLLDDSELARRIRRHINNAVRPNRENR